MCLEGAAGLRVCSVGFQLLGVKHQDRGLACELTFKLSFSSLISSWKAFKKKKKTGQKTGFSLSSLAKKNLPLNLNSSKMVNINFQRAARHPDVLHKDIGSNINSNSVLKWC